MVDTNAILVGPDSTPILIDPAAAHEAFREALDHLAGLATNGGDLYVLPGTSKYIFGEKVIVGTGTPNAGVDNLTIHFSKGAILDFASNPQNTPDALFEVRRRGFRCIGAHVQHQSGNVNGRSCFLINDDGVAGASDDAAFIDCTFDMEQAGNEIRAFSCIRAVGTGSVEQLRRGLHVTRCVFLFRPGVRQKYSWFGNDPYGICAVRGRDSAEFTITASQFRAHHSAAGGVGMCGPAVYLDQCDESVLSSCVFSSLDLKPGPGQHPADDLLPVVRLRTQTSEAHHSIVVSVTLTTLAPVAVVLARRRGCVEAVVEAAGDAAGTSRVGGRPTGRVARRSGPGPGRGARRPGPRSAPATGAA